MWHRGRCWSTCLDWCAGTLGIAAQPSCTMLGCWPASAASQNLRVLPPWSAPAMRSCSTLWMLSWTGPHAHSPLMQESMLQPLFNLHSSLVEAVALRISLLHHLWTRRMWFALQPLTKDVRVAAAWRRISSTTGACTRCASSWA